MSLSIEPDARNAEFRAESARERGEALQGGRATPETSVGCALATTETIFQARHCLPMDDVLPAGFSIEKTMKTTFDFDTKQAFPPLGSRAAPTHHSFSFSEIENGLDLKNKRAAVLDGRGGSKPYLWQMLQLTGVRGREGGGKV